MSPLLLLRNPKTLIMGSLFIGTILFIGILVWRNTYLSDKAAAQEAAIAGYAETIKQLENNAILRDNIAREDHIDSLANERTRADIIGGIESATTNQDGPCAAVLCDNIKLLLTHGSSEDN